MMANADEILNQLHDIQLPPAISFWPPTIGWFVLLGLLIVIVFIGRQLLKRHFDRCRPRNQALKLLAQLQLQHQQKILSDKELASQLSQLLRRVALAYYPRADVAGLQGEKWLAFLQCSGGQVSAVIQQWLLYKPYNIQQDKHTTEDLTELFQFCRTWVGDIYKKPRMF